VKCPYCAHLGDKVVDSRESKEGEVIRRRRECLECGRRFTSYERIDEIPYMVVKKNSSRERVEATLQDRPEKGISTAEIGSFVMQELKRLDKVAYVRFASVYRHFRDINEFMTELKDLLNAKE
jgi:transcriptional repressor NrdR